MGNPSQVSGDQIIRLGICDSRFAWFKFALSSPRVGRKTQICTLNHTNLEAQIPSLQIMQGLKRRERENDLYLTKLAQAM